MRSWRQYPLWFEIREILLYLSRAELQYGGYGGYHLLFDWVAGTHHEP